MTEPTALIEELRGFAAGSDSARATLMRDAADALEKAHVERFNAAQLSHQFRNERDKAHGVIRDACTYLDHPDGWYQNGMPGMRSLLASGLPMESGHVKLHHPDGMPKTMDEIREEAAVMRAEEDARNAEYKARADAFERRLAEQKETP